MIWIKPDYYDRFRCSASACTDTCCAGWEVEVDETTAQMYASMEGSLGQRIREKLVVTPEENYFALENGRCPLLDQENLCEIIREAGEEALCDICREHPRFYHWYGDVTEVGLGLCCEEAAKLIFGSPEKAGFVREELPEEDGSGDTTLLEEDMDTTRDISGGWSGIYGESEDYTREKETYQPGASDDEALYYLNTEQEDRREKARPTLQDEIRDPKAMQKNREAAFYILQDRSYTISRRLQHFLDYGCRLQEVPNPEENMRNIKGSWLRLIRLYRSMETLDDSWPKQLDELVEKLDEVLDREKEFWRYIKDRDYEYEHLAVYLTYRYFPESLYDGKVISKFLFVITSILLMYLLDTLRYIDTGAYTLEDRNNFSRRFSREIEYCPENLELFENYCEEQGSAFIADIEGILWSVRT